MKKIVDRIEGRFCEILPVWDGDVLCLEEATEILDEFLKLEKD